MTIEWIAYLLDNDRADYPGFSVAEDKFAIMFNERFVTTASRQSPWRACRCGEHRQLKGRQSPDPGITVR